MTRPTLNWVDISRLVFFSMGEVGFVAVLDEFVGLLDERLEHTRPCISSVYHAICGQQIHFQVSPQLEYLANSSCKETMDRILHRCQYSATVRWTAWASIGFSEYNAYVVSHKLAWKWGIPMTWDTISPRYAFSLDYHTVLPESGQIRMPIHFANIYLYDYNVFYTPEITLYEPEREQAQGSLSQSQHSEAAQ